MLVELTGLLPKGYQVYVLFDSWYASAKLIQFCRRQRWHVICAVKANRRLNRKRMDHHNQSLRNQLIVRVVPLFWRQSYHYVGHNPSCDCISTTEPPTEPHERKPIR